MKNVNYPSELCSSNTLSENLAYNKTPIAENKLNSAYKILGIKYVNECFNNEFSGYKTEKQNIEVMKSISRFICFINRDFFWTIVEKTPLSEINRDMIKKSGDLVYDTYGRGSHWYIEIGKYKLPIWQPGTVAYHSAMKKNTNLEINSKSAVNCDYQKNGPILDIEDCVFLARFMTDLAQNYLNMCQSQGYDSKDFIPHIYSDSLLTSLQRLARIDAENNGIVNELKHILTCFDPDIIELSDQENCLFHLNEFKTFEMLVKKVPTMNEIKKFRKKNQYWYGYKTLFDFFAETSVFKDHIHEVKICLLRQPYIFENQGDYAELHRFFDTILEEAKNHIDAKYFAGPQMDALSMVNQGDDSGKHSYKNFRDSELDSNMNFSDLMNDLHQDNFTKNDPFDQNRERSSTDGQQNFKSKNNTPGQSDLLKEFEQDNRNLQITAGQCDLLKEFEQDNSKIKAKSSFDGLDSYCIDNTLYTNCYNFKNNDKLTEYYMTIKRSIKRQGQDQLANKGQFNANNYSKVISKVDKFLPLYGGLMKIGCCHDSNSDESRIVKQLTKMQSLYHKDAVLAKRLAYCMTLLNRDHILEYGNEFQNKERKQVGEDFIEMCQKKMYTLPEIKAIRDLKFLEASIIVLINSGKLDLNNKYTTQECVQIILSKWTNYLENKISPPADQGEAPQDFKRTDKIDFPSDVCQESPQIPKILTRKPDEYYNEYIERISEYLKELKTERITEILGDLDPTDNRVSAAIKFLQKVLEEKKSCVIF